VKLSEADGFQRVKFPTTYNEGMNDCVAKGSCMKIANGYLRPIR